MLNPVSSISSRPFITEDFIQRTVQGFTWAWLPLRHVFKETVEEQECVKWSSVNKAAAWKSLTGGLESGSTLRFPKLQDELRRTFSTAENQFSRLRSSIWMWDVCSSSALTLRAKPRIKERISLMLLVRISFLYLKQKEHFWTKEFGGNNYYFYFFYHDQLWQEILTFLYIFKKTDLKRIFCVNLKSFFPLS